MQRCGRERTGWAHSVGLPRGDAWHGDAVCNADHRRCGVGWRLILCALLALVLLFRTAIAEEQAILDVLDLKELEALAQAQGFDFMGWVISAISGEMDFMQSLRGLLDQCKDMIFVDLKGVLTAAIVPAATLLVLKLLLPGGSSTQRTAAFICRLGCISALAAVFARMQSVADALMQEILKVSETLTPVLIAAVSLSGAEITAAFLSPMTALSASMIQRVLWQWGMAITSAAAVIAIAGNLGTGIRLKRLQGLLKQILHWGAGGVLAAFTAVMSIQGRLGAGRDSAATRTARYAIESLIPVIGGNISDSLDSLLTTAYVVKNAVGVSGLMLIVCVCLIPMARMLAFALVLRLTSAITEPLDDEALTALNGQFADCVEMLLILSMAAAVLCGLLVGSCMSAASNVVR